MNVVLLTTDTSHHAYYAWKLSEHFPLRAIFFELRRVLPPFETFHPFERLRDTYERDCLLAGWPGSYSALAEVKEFDSLNDAESISTLKAAAPDVVIVFGTGKLRPSVFRIATLTTLNLHGGNPEQYRGLDTHLWAIYHDDFANLVTTLHHVDSGLDTGDIVFQSCLNLKKDTKLFELRSINTKVCVELSSLALQALQSHGSVPSRRQLQKGRYYSFMPSVLKEECVKKFERHAVHLEMREQR